MRLSLVFAFLAPLGARAAEPPLTIEELLGARVGDRRLRERLRQSHVADPIPPHGQNALVQCGVLYDVTRNPRTIVNCYELR